MRVLIVDNDIKLCNAISLKLKEFGHQSDIAENIEDARYLFSIRHYNIILIESDLASPSVIRIIREIKEVHNKTSVIIFSTKKDKESEISALQSGADDYITKPIDIDILYARIEAKLRFGVSNIIEIDELIINPEEERIIYKGEDVELKGKPFEVLTHLAIHKDQIVSKEQLLDAIWEEPELVTPNVIEVAINQIRQRMDKPLQITTIETVRRRGYRFCFPNKL